MYINSEVRKTKFTTPNLLDKIKKSMTNNVVNVEYEDVINYEAIEEEPCGDNSFFGIDIEKKVKEILNQNLSFLHLNLQDDLIKDIIQVIQEDIMKIALSFMNGKMSNKEIFQLTLKILINVDLNYSRVKQNFPNLEADLNKYLEQKFPGLIVNISEEKCEKIINYINEHPEQLEKIYNNLTDSYDDTDIFDFFKKFDPNNNEFTQTMTFLNNMNDSVNISYESLIKMFPNLEEYLSLTISKKIPSLDVNLENTTLIKDLYNYLLEKPKESGSLINILSSENSISKLRMLLEKIIKLNKKIDLSNETLTKSFPNLNQVLGKMLDDYFQSTDYTFSYNEKGMQDLWNGLITNNENNQLIKGIYSLFPNIQNEIYEQVGINKDDVFKYLNNICNDLPEFIYLIEEIMEEVQDLNDSFEEFNNAGFFEKFGYIGNVSEKGYYSLTSTMELFDFLGVGPFDIFQVVTNLKFKEIPLIGPYLVKSLDKMEDNYEFLSVVGTIAVKKIENFFANLI